MHHMDTGYPVDLISQLWPLEDASPPHYVVLGIEAAQWVAMTQNAEETPVGLNSRYKVDLGWAESGVNIEWL